MRTDVNRVSSAGRPETKEESERWNRDFTELLQELRVVQTGVQILFAFLLTVLFSNRFAGASTLQVVVYTLTFLACAIAVALLIAPASYHRRVFRQGRKAEVVLQADRLALAGLAAFIVAVAGVVFLIMDVLAGAIVACTLSGLVTGVYILLWYVLPSLATSRDESCGPEED